MPKWFSRLTLNQRLALLAFVLGLVAIAAVPTRQGTYSVSPRDMAIIVQRGADHVTPRTLADQLIKGQLDYRLIDLRGEAEYAAYHLPGAENIPISALAAADLPRNEKVLLYSEDEVHAAQAWFLLEAQGHRGAYVLKGGLGAWKDEILHPVVAGGSTTEERRQNDERAAVAAYFGGAPRAAAAAEGSAGSSGAAPVAAAAVPAAPIAPPTLTMPAGGARAKPAKRKEGC